jgi:hypothetical protein
MTYGVVISKDSFVFTRFGVATIGMLPQGSEVLGVAGIGKCTKFQKVFLRTVRSSSTDAKRLITQATDSVLLPDTLIFSEKVQNAGQLVSSNEIEFFCPRQIPNFTPGLDNTFATLQSEEAYGVGLLSKLIYDDPKCKVFLIRNANEGYLSFVDHVVANLVQECKPKIEVEIKKGRLGYAWVVLRGNSANQLAKLLCVSPENACMKLGPKALKNFVAGMLDAHINNPLYGGNPVLTFSKDESAQKRFLHNIFLLYNSRIVETSCITSYAPKLLETTATLSKIIPVRNSAWDDVEASKKSNLFSKTRGIITTQTISAQVTFEEQGFSPIVDGLFAYPCVLQN